MNLFATALSNFCVMKIISLFFNHSQQCSILMDAGKSNMDTMPLIQVRDIMQYMRQLSYMFRSTQSLRPSRYPVAHRRALIRTIITMRSISAKRIKIVVAVVPPVAAIQHPAYLVHHSQPYSFLQNMRYESTAVAAAAIAAAVGESRCVLPSPTIFPWNS